MSIGPAATSQRAWPCTAISSTFSILGTTAACRASGSTATTCTRSPARTARSGSQTRTRRTSSPRPARSASHPTAGSSSSRPRRARARSRSLTSAATPSATPVPFAFTFDPSGRLVSGEAGMSFVTTYTIAGDGHLTSPQSLSDGQMALCWIVRAGDFYYVSNTGSNTLSGYRIDAAGRPSLVGPTGVVATTPAGPIDLAVSGGFLYAQTGTAGTVEEFRIESNGTLTRIGSITGLPPGQEGIAAT